MPKFIVWNPKGKNPRVTHDTKAEAQAEAERLAADQPGDSFYTCQLVSVSCTAAVETISLLGEEAKSNLAFAKDAYTDGFK